MFEKENILLTKLAAFWDVFLVGILIAMIYIAPQLTPDTIFASCIAVSVLYILYRMIHRFARLLGEPYLDFEGIFQTKAPSWVLKYVINPFFFFCTFLIFLKIFQIDTLFIKDLESGFSFAGLILSTRTIIVAGLVLIVFVSITRAIQRLVLHQLQESVEMGVAFKNSLASVIGYFGITIALCSMFTALGANILPFVILLGIVLFGFFTGFKDVIQNAIAGLVILWDSPIKIGDWIAIDEQEGFVSKITLCSTEISTLEKASVIVPNSAIMGQSLINWTHKDNIGRIDVAVTLPYGTKLDKVKKILLQIAKKHPSVLDDPAPSVAMLDIKKTGIELALRCFIPNKVQRLSIANTLREEIYNAFTKSNIKL